MELFPDRIFYDLQPKGLCFGSVWTNWLRNCRGPLGVFFEWRPSNFENRGLGGRDQHRQGHEQTVSNTYATCLVGFFGGMMFCRRRLGFPAGAGFLRRQNRLRSCGRRVRRWNDHQGAPGGAAFGRHSPATPAIIVQKNASSRQHGGHQLKCSARLHAMEQQSRSFSAALMLQAHLSSSAPPR